MGSATKRRGHLPLLVGLGAKAASAACTASASDLRAATHMYVCALGSRHKHSFTIAFSVHSFDTHRII